VRHSNAVRHSGRAASRSRPAGLDALMRFRKASLDTKSAARLELFARRHRSSLTESETRLWSGLKACALD
jgi:hypothetical protein